MRREHIARWLALLVLLVSIIVMIGWFLDIAVLKSIMPQWATMKFTTALSFGFSGIILLAGSAHLVRRSYGAEWILAVSSFVVLLLMSSLIVSVLLGIKTGIEDLFVREVGDAVLTTVPGRPSLGTMLAFILIGLFGAFAAFNALKEWAVRVCGGLVTFLGVVSLVGYAIDAPVLYYAVEDVSTAMAFHTALLFVFLGIGISLLPVMLETESEVYAHSG